MCILARAPAQALVAPKAVIAVFRIPEEWHPYPWRFTITYKGICHSYTGIRNKCATKRSASMRARWRAKWLEDGSYATRYG